ncbi:hypothetical protein [Shewanella sp. TC10]|uniref:hypothetical protein n=1 Tax=Shewanella sp. TC10 TaxID=1419739 RepID=UPI00129E98D0|nr:hypothetical protein [Shewanella sp. TC10]
MNPIDKITEPTFTNSSKGLLTLFCIGLVHTVIGVDLTSTEIAIPWFPSINFPNPERITYLYWGLVVFAMYRYTLYHLHIIRNGYCRALMMFLNSSSLGKNFIDKNVFSDGITHQVSFEDDGESAPTIKIQHYTYDGDPEAPTQDDNGWDLAASVEFVFTDEYALEKITFSENPTYDFEEMALKKPEVRESWGLKEFIYDDHSSTFKSAKINDFKLRYGLRFNVLRNYLKILMSSKDEFDLLVPLLLNLTLLVLWLAGLLLNSF